MFGLPLEFIDCFASNGRPLVVGAMPDNQNRKIDARLYLALADSLTGRGLQLIGHRIVGMDELCDPLAIHAGFRLPLALHYLLLLGVGRLDQLAVRIVVLWGLLPGPWQDDKPMPAGVKRFRQVGQLTFWQLEPFHFAGAWQRGDVCHPLHEKRPRRFSSPSLENP